VEVQEIHSVGIRKKKQQKIICHYSQVIVVRIDNQDNIQITGIKKRV
jgi:NACalpha-BTF3-like transcription factor